MIIWLGPFLSGKSSLFRKKLWIFLFYDLFPCRKHFLMQGFPLAGKRAHSDNLVSVATDLTTSVNSQIQFVWSRAYDKNKPGCGQKTLRKQWGPESTENGYGNQWEVLSTKWETLPSRVPAAPRLGSMSVSHLPILASCHLTQVFETKMKVFSEELKDIWASGVADCLSTNGQRQ